MAGLVPAIHVFPYSVAGKTWITGTSPVMTTEYVEAPRLISSVLSPVL